MFRKLFLINLSLFLAAVLLALWLLDIWQTPLGVEAEAKPISPKLIEAGDYSFEKMETGSGYDLMVERDLFRPDRQRYIPPEPSVKPTPKEDESNKEKPNFMVIGIMILSDKVKYAIVGEKPAEKPKPKRPTRAARSRRPRRTRRTPEPTPTPEDLIETRSYHEGEEVKDGWFVAEIKHTSVVFSNGAEVFEVAMPDAEIPEDEEAEEDQEDEDERKPSRTPRKLDSPFSRDRRPTPPDKDEATQRFLDALRKAGKKE